MPELPEVQTVITGLQKTVLKKTFARAEIFAPRVARYQIKSIESGIKGKTIRQITRRGKNILFGLTGNHTLLAHLGMTGHMFYYHETSPKDKHDAAVFRFKEGGELHFHDTRKFGKLILSNGKSGSLPTEKLGPEPLEITLPEFIKLFRSRKRMVKPALLDQTILAGLGNIYTDEALFEAKIHPQKTTDRLSTEKLKALHSAIRKILQRAIKTGGSSVANYVDVEGKPGHFQIYHKVYGKTGNSCPRCGTKIKRIVVGQRSSHYCPRCQTK